MKRKTVDTVLYVFLAAAIVLSIVNVSVIIGRMGKVKVAEKETALLAAEEARPAVLELVKIVGPSCEECFDINTVIGNLKKANVKVTSERTVELSSPEAQKLIERYSIEKLPTLVVLGEVNKSSLVNLWTQDWQVEMANGTQVSAVYAAVAPPYINSSGSIKGLVNVTLVNVSSCKECQDLTPAVKQLRTQVKVADFKVVDKDSEEGKKLVAEYEMARLPGLLVSNDVNEYPLAAQLAQVGTVKKNGVIALGANPPYLNVSTGKVTGVTQLILLNDSSCTGCYDVTMHVPIVRRFQVYTGSIKTVDAASSEGKELISKYRIIAVPTILITGDVSPYEQLLGIWPTVGTVESDGTYVFRTMSAIRGSVYKDLQTGQLVTPQQPTSQPAVGSHSGSG